MRMMPLRRNMRRRTAGVLVQPEEARDAGCVLAGRRNCGDAPRENRADDESRGDSLAGAHNVENVLAAVIIARLAGVDSATIAKAVKSFAGVEHRLEFVGTFAGALLQRFEGDERGRNAEALDAFPGRIW